MCFPAERQLSATGVGALSQVAGLVGATGMVPVSPVVVVLSNVPVIADPEADSRGDRIVDDELSLRDGRFPVVASLTSAVTETGDLPSDGFGLTEMCEDTGPTPSVLGGGALVSRKVIMPPKAS